MVSEYFATDANQDVSADPRLALLTITHASLDQPIRLVLNGEDFVSRGVTYRFAPFELTPPEQTKDGVQPARLRIENISGEIITVLRTAAGTSEPPQASWELVFASAPDIVEKTWPGLVFLDAHYDDSIDVSLGMPDLTREPFSQYRFTRKTHPGLVY
jgi:hypothetical protein